MAQRRYLKPLMESGRIRAYEPGNMFCKWIALGKAPVVGVQPVPNCNWDFSSPSSAIPHRRSTCVAVCKTQSFKVEYGVYMQSSEYPTSHGELRWALLALRQLGRPRILGGPLKPSFRGLVSALVCSRGLFSLASLYTSKRCRRVVHITSHTAS